MNTKNYFFSLIVGILCFVATGVISPLRAQTNETTKAPLSFYRLGNDQAIEFSVSAEHTSFSAAPVVFEVEVSNQPQPQAKIRMEINASMRVPKAEKAWGHSGEVTRSLQPADLQTLENFLTTYRAKGAVPPPRLSGQPAMAFTRITYRTNQQGNRYADADRKDFYPVSEVAERDFIKNFIGLNESNGN